MDVRPGGEQYVHPVFQHLVPHGPAHLFHQLRIPCGGQHRCDGKAGAIVGAALWFPDGGYPQSRRSVGEDDLRYAQPRYAVYRTCCARHPFFREAYSVERLGGSAAHQQYAFLLGSHCRYNLLDIVFPEPGRTRRCTEPRQEQDGGKGGNPFEPQEVYQPGRQHGDQRRQPCVHEGGTQDPAAVEHGPQSPSHHVLGTLYEADGLEELAPAGADGVKGGVDRGGAYRGDGDPERTHLI